MIKTHLAEKMIDPSDSFAEYKREVIHDYYIACVSREASLLARKEVMTGKAKFGIIGDGKELPQIAWAKFFKPGDWRSGYYRDQTFMFATQLSSVQDFFAQLYADTDNDPFSGGRQMNSHYATPLIDKDDNWLDVSSALNVSADVSCTGGQMPRALGLALASKQYRNRPIRDSHKFSNNGNEISFVSIGDASTSEGAFWETMNAAAVMKVPLITCVWDDGYGISVPKELQTTKGSISKALEGFIADDNGSGIHIYTVKGWDYQDLCRVFEQATKITRETHIPALIHVEELTQPQGHSTSGSHERYKSAERLEWEANHDCIKKFGEWIIQNAIASEQELESLLQEAKQFVREAKTQAWENYNQPIRIINQELKTILGDIAPQAKGEFLIKNIKDLDHIINPNLGELVQKARRVRIRMVQEGLQSDALDHFIESYKSLGDNRYDTHLYASSNKAAINIPVVKPTYNDHPEVVNGYQVLNTFFDKMLAENDSLIAFGEDVGQIGDVNQGFAGLQEKYGVKRVFDTGIREWTIIGQGIGAAMRGLRPIAEIQYLDYIGYAFSPLNDDLATLRYRSNGIQAAPLIVRSRGHRLEGIWHAGSPMGTLINSMKGIYLCVPRDMVRAAGMYRTLLYGNDPAIVIECLNGYRLKEALPENLGSYTVPLGIPEILHEGHHITIVTYGSCVRPAHKATNLLADHGISAELIDVQTLLPFDMEGIIVNSLKKTNRILFVDEDVPGGATAFMMQQVLERDHGYRYLDSKPSTLTAKEHRTPFGSDGDYFTKPEAEDIFEKVYEIIIEAGIM